MAFGQFLSDPFDRAWRTYSAAMKAKVRPAKLPSKGLCGELTHDGVTYYALRNSHRFLAIFKIAKGGRLLYLPKFDLNSLDTDY